MLYCDADINDNAAIGADDQKGDCGTVIIHGGNITADTAAEGTDGAGIGGGDEGNLLPLASVTVTVLVRATAPEAVFAAAVTLTEKAETAARRSSTAVK